MHSLTRKGGVGAAKKGDEGNEGNRPATTQKRGKQRREEGRSDVRKEASAAKFVLQHVPIEVWRIIRTIVRRVLDVAVVAKQGGNVRLCIVKEELRLVVVRRYQRPLTKVCYVAFHYIAWHYSVNQIDEKQN